MNDSASSAPATTPAVRRRTLVKGAAWAIPSVVTAVAAPAYAASRPSVGGAVCQLFYRAGAGVNYQTHSMSLAVTSSTSSVPAGTVITWTVALSGGSVMEVPTTNYSANGRWTLATSPAAGTAATSFTVTLTVNNSDVTVSELNCTPRLIWNDTSSVTGGTTVSISSTTTGSNIGTGVASALSYRVAARYPTSVNSRGRRAHAYLSKSGGQACYPAIQYVMTAASKLSTCGDNGNDTSTTYPDGTCARLPGTTADQGSQKVLPQKC